MVKYKEQSASVLNEADRYTRILDWQLFSMEQDMRLFGYNPDVEWVPGDPLFQDPRTMGLSRLCVCADCQPSTMPEGYEGNYVRPLFQLIEEHPRRARCEDCDVFWRGLDPCFVCGKDNSLPLTQIRQSLRFSAQAFEDAAHQMTTWAQLMIDNMQALDMSSPSYSFIMFDELQSTAPWQNLLEHPYLRPYAPPVVDNPFMCDGERIVLPTLSDCAADPVRPLFGYDRVVTMPTMSPEELGSQIRTQPLPEFECNYFNFPDVDYSPGWVEIPATERRRTR